MVSSSVLIDMARARDVSLLFVGRDLVESPESSKHSLVVNTQHRLLLCLSCQYAIIPSQLKSHLDKNHSARLEADDQKGISRLLNVCGVAHTELPSIASETSEIEGLPVRKGHPCPSCPTVASNLESIKSHMRQHHKGVTYPRADATVSFQLIRHNRLIRIQVQKEAPSEFTTEGILAQAAKMAERASSEAESAEAAATDPREFCPWLRRVRWHELALGKDVGVLIELVAQPKKDEFSALSDGLLHLFRSASPLFASTSELVLQRLHSPKQGEEFNPQPFRELEEVQSLRLPVLGLLAMLLRGSPVPLTSEMQVAIRGLRSSLCSQEPHLVSEHVLSVLALIWMHPWTPLINHRISDPTIVYLALWSLEPSGKFKSAKEVTNPIAKLEYDMRLVFLVLINREPSAEQGYEKYKRFFKEGVESTFNSLRNAQRQASSISYLTPELPKIWWLDRKHHRELLYKGTRIHVDQLQHLLGSLEQKTRDVWEKQVLLGLKLSVDYRDIHDDLSCSEVGYSFLSDPRNGHVFSDKQRLLRAILSDKELGPKFVSLNRNGALRFNAHMARSWLQSLSTFHRLLLLRFYLTGGSPARGTEMVMMLLLNTFLYPLRNLVAFGPHIALLCTYMKTSSLSGVDKLIPHGLDSFTADLLVQELAIARPFAILMAGVAHPGDLNVVSNLTKHVFVNHTRLFNTKDITQALQDFSVPAMNIKLGVSDWRHVSSAFRRKLCPRLQDLLEEDEGESIGALQMGHNTQTDTKVYGVSQDALRGASEDILPLYLDATTDWQVLCRVVPGGLHLRYEDALMSCFQPLVRKGLITIQSPQQQIEDRLTGLEGQLTRVQEDVSQLDAKINLILSLLRPQAEPRVDGDREALVALKRALNRPEAVWKSEGQREAVRAVLDRKHDVVAILPTNAGKSMVAIVPALVERTLVTVLILPLRILLMDFERKLRSMGVPFFTYDSEAPGIRLGSANLVLVSADRVQWDEWQQAIAVLHEHRTVARLVVDEAHIPLLSQDYRHALKHMSDIRCGIPLQIVLLTASGPTELLDAMRDHYAIEEDAILVREPSNRPELRYVWQTVQDADAMLPVIRSAIAHEIQRERDRGIIFVPWKALGELLASHFKMPFYYGGNSDNENIYQSWLAGREPVVVATSAFGTGNDCAHVRLVVHAEAPYEMVNYAQEVSRGGRDESPALCLLLLSASASTRQNPPPEVDRDLSGRAFLHAALQGHQQECIRHTITGYNDGPGVFCDSDTKNQLCGRCRSTQKQRLVDAHLTPAFQQQTEVAKRRKVERIVTGKAYEDHLRECLRLVSQTCSFCFVRASPYTKVTHKFLQCDVCVKDEFIQWRTRIRYKAQGKSKVCFLCHVPQGSSDSLHPTFTRDAQKCEFRDVIAPLVFALLSTPEQRASLQSAFPGINTSTPVAALEWINSGKIDGHSTNLVALFLWFSDQYLP